MSNIHCPSTNDFENGIIDFYENCDYTEDIENCRSTDGVFLLCSNSLVKNGLPKNVIKAFKSWTK